MRVKKIYRIELKSDFIDFPENFSLSEKIFFALEQKYSHFWMDFNKKKRIKNKVDKFVEKNFPQEEEVKFVNYQDSEKVKN